MGPSKGIESLGERLKPSSVLRTSRSAQSEGRGPQLGLGSWTLSPVRGRGSGTVDRSRGVPWVAYGEPVAGEGVSGRHIKVEERVDPGRQREGRPQEQNRHGEKKGTASTTGHGRSRFR